MAGEISIHEINPASEFCFLKTKCRPYREDQGYSMERAVAIHKKTVGYRVLIALVLRVSRSCPGTVVALTLKLT